MAAGVLGFSDLLSQGALEYLDVNEENDARIAVYEKEIREETTHLEVPILSFIIVCLIFFGRKMIISRWSL